MTAFVWCLGCRAPIFWTVTRLGKRMPVDRDPVADGNVLIWDDGRQMNSRTVGPEEKAINNYELRMSHHATCKQRPAKKKGKRRGGGKR